MFFSHFHLSYSFSLNLFHFLLFACYHWSACPQSALLSWVIFEFHLHLLWAQLPLLFFDYLWYHLAATSCTYTFHVFDITYWLMLFITTDVLFFKLRVKSLCWYYFVVSGWFHLGFLGDLFWFVCGRWWNVMLFLFSGLLCCYC